MDHVEAARGDERTDGIAPSAAAAIESANTERDQTLADPYYRAGAPMRSDLVDPGMEGTRLSMQGRVLGPDCTTPPAGAVLDLWSADASGHYDNDRTRDLDDAMLLRGRVSTPPTARSRSERSCRATTSMDASTALRTCTSWSARPVIRP